MHTDLRSHQAFVPHNIVSPNIHVVLIRHCTQKLDGPWWCCQPVSLKRADAIMQLYFEVEHNIDVRLGMQALCGGTCNHPCRAQYTTGPTLQYTTLTCNVKQPTDFQRTILQGPIQDLVHVRSAGLRKHCTQGTLQRQLYTLAYI